MIDIAYTRFDDNTMVIGKDLIINKDLIDLSKVESSQVEFIKFLKRRKPFALFNAELSGKRDFLHHRRSGLNHIIFKEMAGLGIHYVLNFSLLYDERAHTYMGRMMQNIRLARKAKVLVIPASFSRDYRLREIETKGLLRLLGMDSKDIKRAFEFTKR